MNPFIARLNSRKAICCKKYYQGSAEYGGRGLSKQAKCPEISELTSNLTV